MKLLAWRGIPAASWLGVLLAACVSPEKGTHLLDVPFIQQPPDHCGSASVAMVARFYGVEPDGDALDRDIFVPALSGSIPALLAEGARRQGLAAEVRHCSEEELHALISAGMPLIVLLAPVGDSPRGHFVVATGSNPATGALRVHSGTRPNHWLSRRAWQARWIRADRAVVLIRPLDSVPPLCQHPASNVSASDTGKKP